MAWIQNTTYGGLCMHEIWGWTMAQWSSICLAFRKSQIHCPAFNFSFSQHQPSFLKSLKAGGSGAASQEDILNCFVHNHTTCVDELNIASRQTFNQCLLSMEWTPRKDRD